MNVLPQHEIERIGELTLAGKSHREIVTITGLARNTVRNWRNKTLAKNHVLCRCGKDIQHQGWCRFRLSRSPLRQDFLSRWKRHQKIDWVWRVLKRISRNRFVPKNTMRECLMRLARKHSKRPKITVRQLMKLHWFDRDCKGVINGKGIFDHFQIAWHKDPAHPENVCWIDQRKPCAICTKKVAFVDHSESEQPTCGSEWCERLYTFYYLEGRSRPPKVRDGKNNGLAFELFLADYIRRYAHEQAIGSKHRRTT